MIHIYSAAILTVNQSFINYFQINQSLAEFLFDLRPYSPTPVNVNCRLKYFVTLVTYCYNNVFVYFNLQLTLTGVGEYGPYKAINLCFFLVHKI
jgi:hypothetical protein